MENYKDHILLLLSSAMVLSFTFCNSISPDILLQSPGARGEIISILLKDTAYLNQVMDSILASADAQIVMINKSDIMGKMIDDRKMMMRMMMEDSFI